MKEAEIEKTKCFHSQNYAIGLSKNHKIKALSRPNFSGKNDYFLSYFVHFLVKKGTWSHFKGLESKSHLPYCSLTTLGHISVQRVGSHHIPVLSFSVPKVVFFFQFQATFSSLAAFIGTTPLF